jgi:hypothetical protein
MSPDMSFLNEPDLGRLGDVGSLGIVEAKANDEPVTGLKRMRQESYETEALKRQVLNQHLPDFAV